MLPYLPIRYHLDFWDFSDWLNDGRTLYGQNYMVFDIAMDLTSLKVLRITATCR